MFGTGAVREGTGDESERGWRWAPREGRDEVLELGGKCWGTWGASASGDVWIDGDGAVDAGSRHDVLVVGEVVGQDERRRGLHR